MQSDFELASKLLAIRTKLAMPDLKFSGRRASSKQLRRIFSFMHYRMAQPKLSKVMLQMITGMPLMDMNDRVSGYALTMWQASTLITEMELKNGSVGSMLLSRCEERLNQSPTLTPWRVFDAEWISTALRDMQSTDTKQQL